MNSSASSRNGCTQFATITAPERGELLLITAYDDDLHCCIETKQSSYGSSEILHVDFSTLEVPKRNKVLESTRIGSGL